MQSTLRQHPQQQQQQRNDSGLTAHASQILDHPGVGLPQGQVPLERSFVRPSPSVRPENVESSSTPSPQTLGQRPPSPSIKISDLSLPQLRLLQDQVSRTLIEGEKALQASGASTSGGEGDIQLRQQLRSKLDPHKQRSFALQELIDAKARESGDPTQPVIEPSWPGQNQQSTALYPTPGRSSQHNGPSFREASANHGPPQLSQIVEPFSQESIQAHGIPYLPEYRFKSIFMRFLAAVGITVTERDVIIEGRPVNLWALHRVVLSRNGFESVCANNEWPFIGIAMGFPVFSGGDGGQPARCAPAVVQRLRQLYNGALRQFEQAYISGLGFTARFRALRQAPQPPQPPPPTEKDYEALLAKISSRSSAGETIMNMTVRFAHTSCAELEAHGVPNLVIAYIERFREHLQFMALHGLQFPRPVSEDYVGSAIGARQGFLEHGQQLPLSLSGLMMDELKEAMGYVTSPQ